jgi:hypothetical protein
MKRSSVVAAATAFACALLIPAASAQALSLFSPTGPWNGPLPASPALDPNSAAIVSTMASKIATIQAGGTYPYLNTVNYSTPIYRVGPSTPKHPITMNTSDTTLQNAINANGGVPFPAGAQPAPGTDGHITVYDQTSQKLYEFWHASSPEMNGPLCTTLPWKGNRLCYRDSKWHADWGGIMDNVDTDPGFYSVNSWPGLTGKQGYNWGSTATSLPVVAGTITFDDLNAGVINHALAAAFVNSCQSYFMAPAQRRDGTDTDANCLPEGAKLQLDPSYDVNADSNPPIAKMVERAAQTYGIIIRDNTGGSFGFYGQDPQTEPSNPYTSGPGVGGTNNGGKGYFGGLQPWQLFQSFPWSRLRVVQSTHCTAAPCL